MKSQILATWKAIAFALLLAVGAALASGRGTAHARTPHEVIAGRIRSLRLAPARRHGSLAIIPVRGWSDGKLSVRTLSQALHSGDLAVGEMDEGRVNELYVDNRSSSYVFIMAGEILVGAKQNRILQNDLLLPPHSGRIAVGAFCVQHGRWEYEGGRDFEKSDNVSNPAVRRAARETSEQVPVWDAVAATQRSVVGAVAPESPRDYEAVSASGDLNEIADRTVASKVGQEYREALSDLPDRIPDMCGAVVLIHGRVLAADLFADHALLRELWPPLLASYIVEAVRSDAADPEVSLGMAREFLDQAARAAVTRHATPGAGILVDLRGARSSGEALLSSGAVVHLELFPREGAAPADDGEEPPLQRSYRK